MYSRSYYSILFRLPRQEAIDLIMLTFSLTELVEAQEYIPHLFLAYSVEVVDGHLIRDVSAKTEIIQASMNP